MNIFPTTPENEPRMNGSAGKGITQRELFSAMAMQGLLRGAIPLGPEEYKEVAEHAIGLADALLRKLNK